MAWISLTRTATASHGGIYRTNNATLGAWIATLCACLFVGLAFVQPRAQVFDAIAAAVFFALAWRTWLLGVRIGRDGVKVAGLFFTTRVAWGDIDHFTMEAKQNGTVARLIRKDGQRSLATFAIAGGRSEKTKQRAQSVIDLLNQALEDWRNKPGDQAPHAST
jgi:hypothetical protein